MCKNINDFESNNDNKYSNKMFYKYTYLIKAEICLLKKNIISRINILNVINVLGYKLILNVIKLSYIEKVLVIFVEYELNNNTKM